MLAFPSLVRSLRRWDGTGAGGVRTGNKALQDLHLGHLLCGKKTVYSWVFGDCRIVYMRVVKGSVLSCSVV